MADGSEIVHTFTALVNSKEGIEWRIFDLTMKLNSDLAIEGPQIQP